MLKKRLIACIIVKDNWVVQSIGFNQYLPVGRPTIAVEYLARWDVDEIVLLDISATQAGRIPDVSLIASVLKKTFVPLTVGGGIKSVADVKKLIQAGVEKVAINSSLFASPQIITEAANIFGSQCIVASIDAKISKNSQYQVFSHSGQIPTGKHPQDWARELQELGAGEILINSIDRDGSKQGFDLDLINGVAQAVSIPVIACGGAGKPEHFLTALNTTSIDAVAAANIFHYMEHSVVLVKSVLKKNGVDIRLLSDVRYADTLWDGRGRSQRKAEIVFNEI